MHGQCKGFSLAEVLVATVILGLLTTIGFFILQFGSHSSRKASLEVESFRQGSQAVSRVRREMRGARVIEPLEGYSDAVVYEYPLVMGDTLVVNSSGNITWDGPARIFQDGDTLKLEKPVGGTVQVLARLDGGRFSVLIDDPFVQFGISVGSKSSPESYFERSFRVVKR
jgi:prepilin-type N-terminal cleavage/methylation domain-containing protein